MWVDVKVKNIKKGDIIRRRGYWNWSKMVKIMSVGGNMFVAEYVSSLMRLVWWKEHGGEYLKYQRWEMEE